MSIHMHRSIRVDGHDVIFRRSIAGWVMVLAGDYIVTIREEDGRWIGRKQWALEPLAVSPTLKGCASLVLAHYRAYVAETHARCQARLAAALRERTP